MDPADTISFHKALEVRGALLGQQSLALQELRKATHSLLAFVDRQFFGHWFRLPEGLSLPGVAGLPEGPTHPAATGLPEGSTPPAATGLPEGSTPPAAAGLPEGPTRPAATGLPEGSTPPAAAGLPEGPTRPAAAGLPEGWGAQASGRKMEKFSMSVNIAAQSGVTFILTHEELLTRKHGNYELMTRVKPKQLIQTFEIVVDIYEPQGIAFLDAHGTFISNELLLLLEKTVTDTKAHVSFSPTLDQQRTCPDCDGTLIDGDFFIKYDVNREKGIGSIQIVNGYFVHFFAPTDLTNVPKNVLFVIDISGSMYGTKIQQTREALLTILDDIHPDDYFGIVLFDDTIVRMKPSLSKATEQNVKEAKDYVRKIIAVGSTDINGGVLEAVKMIEQDTAEKKLPERSVSMVILLTDGQPNSGESRLDKIQENVQKAMGGNMTLFCLGFGYDVDYNFLDVMAKQNNGLARRIYTDSDAALQLHGFYSEVASPLLAEVNMHYPETAVNSLTNHHFKQLFNGSEIVVAGRLSDNDLDNFLVEVSAQGMEEDLSFKGQAHTLDWNVVFPDAGYIFGDFTERLWAYLTIQQLLSKKDSSPEHEKANISARALELSLQYSFVTPLTSMVATKPQSDEAPGDTLIADKLTEDERQHSSSRYYAPPVTSYHYHPVTSVDGDPHFIIDVPERNDSLCFNIDEAPGTIFNLVRDPLSASLPGAMSLSVVTLMILQSLLMTQANLWRSI
ncbi:hypothetical protein AAFF_G00073680 [Aldrovandia affinis]|uniref:VWFA domain-containing protein n=1 Tax=Aldrovandia affinis TaxID=143900 RepID=A0AAD7R1X1_9TELE|nr:hypothetical protein AAFF_G00073680 [Aldrovandia affinis]